MNFESASFRNTLFPLSAAYDRSWIKRNSLGENVLYNLESLCEIMEFKEGMRVLDLGCGKAASAIFLAKEFGVEVWAVDQFIAPSENYQRIKDMNCEQNVYPLKLNAKELPFPVDFFDAIVSVDSYMYFGTDERFTPYISQFLKPGGTIGVVDVCFSKEINYLAEVPEFMRENYQPTRYSEPGAKAQALARRLAACRAEGVVFCAPSFCDPALLDQPLATRAVDAAGVPWTAFKYAENTGQFQVIREQAGTFADSIKLWTGAA